MPACKTAALVARRSKAACRTKGKPVAVEDMHGTIVEYAVASEMAR